MYSTKSSMVSPLEILETFLRAKQQESAPHYFHAILYVLFTKAHQKDAKSYGAKEVGVDLQTSIEQYLVSNSILSPDHTMSPAYQQFLSSALKINKHFGKIYIDWQKPSQKL